MKNMTFAKCLKLLSAIVFIAFAFTLVGFALNYVWFSVAIVGERAMVCFGGLVLSGIVLGIFHCVDTESKGGW